MVALETCPSEFVTVMVAAPAALGVVVQVMDVALTIVGEVQLDPCKRGIDPVAKFVPVIVINVPPAVEPVVGATAVTVGGAR
jgi:hypothetical protein